jgi:DNA-binding NtrC family response regulator
VPLLEAFASHAAVSLLNARLMRRSEESRLLLTRENEDLRAEARSSSRLGQIVGGSAAMQAVFDRIRLLKDTRVPVLLLGESGTGKDLVARALHYEGIHRDGPFVPVNCAGLPGDLLDSLMFGHRKGAFTGATHDEPGLVEQADGGTLFLDEIGDMPMPLQVKLLRFLEAGEFRRVGEVELRRAQTRVLSATNHDLAQLVRDKSFREDLYFRLAGVCVEIPPLRERRQDIPLLVDFFFEQSRERLPRRVAGISDGARAFFMSHPWPGNVRQLRNTIEGACALVPEGSFLEESHLRMLFPQGASGEDASGHRRPPRTEREVLEAILDRHDWNVTRAAEELGFSRQHLHNRMRLHELKRPESQ